MIICEAKDYYMGDYSIQLYERDNRKTEDLKYLHICDIKIIKGKLTILFKETTNEPRVDSS